MLQKKCFYNLTHVDKNSKRKALVINHNNKMQYSSHFTALSARQARWCYSVSLRQSRMAVWYGTFRICILRTSHLEPYRTSVPYFSSSFEAYRIRTNTKKAYRTIVPYFLAKIEVYCTVPTYHTVLPSLALVS